MDQQRLLLDASPAYVLVCILVAIGYAALLYRRQHPWSQQMNRILFALRAILVFFLAFLLLGPIVRQIRNLMEKPVFVILQDNSGSLLEVEDTVALSALQDRLIAAGEALEETGYDVHYSDLNGEEADRPAYTVQNTDLQSSLRAITNRFEGQKLGGVLLVSDGIYNAGLSPLYTNYTFPVHTLGVGDTTERSDIMIRNVSFNKVAYQGNRFPIRVEVLVKGLKPQPIGVSVMRGGRAIDRQVKTPDPQQLLVFDFQPLAEEKGIQQYDIAVDVLPEEFNKRNNRMSVFVEVVEGKKQILVIAAAPHPDIKALRSVVEANSNYAFQVHIPGVSELPPTALDPATTDLAIFHQAPEQRGRTRELVRRFVDSKAALFFILGSQTDIPFLAGLNLPLVVEGNPRDVDEVTASVNPAFHSFNLSSETTSRLTGYPPVQVPFGKIRFPLSAQPLLFQTVGSLPTERPLLAVDVQNDRKVAILLGEGIWRWRLDEFEDAERTESFDELTGKLIQYLSTADDKRKFRSYPLQQEFSVNEPAIFESQVYNDIFEPVYGNTIEIQLRSDKGASSRYTYTTSPSNSRYSIGGLEEGVYRYTARTTINGANESVEGQFAVVARVAELQNLTADFDLLKSLSAQTGGEFFSRDSLEHFTRVMTSREATGVICSEETFNPMINLTWIFWALVLLVSVEWFTRKYLGSY